MLVTNQVGSAFLFNVARGLLKGQVTLQTGDNSLSGALSDKGAYVLTGKQLNSLPAGSLCRPRAASRCSWATAPRHKSPWRMAMPTSPRREARSKCFSSLATVISRAAPLR